MTLREDLFEWTRLGFLGLIEKNPGHYADAIVYGEGEIALETILKYKNNPDEIGALIDTGHESSWGIIYKDRKGDLHISKKPGIVSDLSVLPIPVYPLDEGHIPVAFIETSRGCAYKCPFCEMPGLYKTRRLKTKKQIEAEISYLQERGIRHVIITDPAIYPSKRMDMISEVFAGREMRWTGYAKPGRWRSRRPLYSKETLRKARESGCVSLFFGGESACEITQEAYDKPKPEVLVATEQLCQEVGLLSCWSFMILNPGETSQGVDRLIALLKEMSPKLAVFTPFTLMPDSEMDRHPGKYKLRITDPKYKLKAPEVYAKLSRSVGVDKKERMRHLVTKYPWLARFLLKILLRNADYFRCIETGFGLADGTFELLRLESALIRETNIEVGRSNYHLLFEMAATDEKT